MKEKLKNSRDKDVKLFKKDYSKGESSPFREWQDKKGSYNQDSEMNEPMQANPDILSEITTPWYRAMATEEQKKLVEYLLSNLTQRQRQIVELVGLEGKTLDNSAVILGVSKRTIQTTLDRIRKKFSKLVVQND